MKKKTFSNVNFHEKKMDTKVHEQFFLREYF